MHEYPITQQIIRTAEQYASREGAKRIHTITLVVGDYSGYVADSIALYFDIISQGSMCEGAKLVIERIKPMLKCTKCNKLFERQPPGFECPFCGGDGAPCDVGREFYIKSVEISS